MISTIVPRRDLSGQDLAAVASELRSLAIRALKRMYRPRERLFAFRLRREGGRDVLEGISRRYTATVLIGLAGEAEEVASEVLGGGDVYASCGRLLEAIGQACDLGEVALTLWAARCTRHPDVSKALERMRSMDPDTGHYRTVELAWSLAALVVGDGGAADEALARAIARRLLASLGEGSALFPHWPDGAQVSRLRGHVSCFADVVYPIQALSHYHQATGDAEAIEAARRCAGQMCELQGPDGQWWWHYDVRTGRVVEQFPVYAVHQDAMAPMALFALEEACGVQHRGAIERGIHWLIDPPGMSGSLIDRRADVIWRKVARHEPAKLVRGVQAAASRLHPSLRVPGVNLVLPPGRVDYESRPNHKGWIHHAWPERRVEQIGKLEAKSEKQEART